MNSDSSTAIIPPGFHNGAAALWLLLLMGLQGTLTLAALTDKETYGNAQAGKQGERPRFRSVQGERGAGIDTILNRLRAGDSIPSLVPRNRNACACRSSIVPPAPFKKRFKKSGLSTHAPPT